MDSLIDLSASLDALFKDPAPEPAKDWQPQTLPALEGITVISAHFFDNGADVQINRRYAVSIQLFTQTEPFTPCSKLAAWEVTAGVLRGQNAFDHWMRKELPRHHDKITPDQAERLRQANVDFQMLPTDGDFPRIGMPLQKVRGSQIEWNLICQVHIDGKQDRICTLIIHGQTIELEFMPRVKTVRKGPKEYANFDPKGLLIRKVAR